MEAFEALLDYRRCVSEIYGQVRQTGSDDEEAWRSFRRQREVLFASHSQSALSEEQKDRFSGLRYFPFNPELRFVLPVDHDVEGKIYEIEADSPVRLHRFGRICFSVSNQKVCLSLFWIAGYGGGLFLPFRDRTNGVTTYGGGRYLLDSVKHADLGQVEGSLVIDFNYAYNPSCAYNPRWHCPLPPEENWLPVEIRGGEKSYGS
jgi:uncharacterized protein (DUF1684 family)